MKSYAELEARLKAETERADANARDAERAKREVNRFRALLEHRTFWAFENWQARRTA